MQLRAARMLDDDGHVSVFRQPSGNSNGNIWDYQGRQISMEHLNRRVTRYDLDGGSTVLADSWNGKRLNSPNDAAAHSDGSIWFTDPPYGGQLYEGDVDQPGGPTNPDGKINGRAGQPTGFPMFKRELPTQVYRLDPRSGRATVVAAGMGGPDGITFSPDEKKLYIVDSAGGRNKGEPKHIRVFDVGEGGKLTGGKEFADCTAGRFDGMRFDTDGRLWAATDDGVHCLDTDGTLIGKIKIPEICSNVVFGGPKRNMLYITATNSLYGVMVHVNGHRTF